MRKVIILSICTVMVIMACGYKANAEQSSGYADDVTFPAGSFRTAEDVMKIFRTVYLDSPGKPSGSFALKFWANEKKWAPQLVIYNDGTRNPKDLIIGEVIEYANSMHYPYDQPKYDTNNQYKMFVRNDGQPVTTAPRTTGPATVSVDTDGDGVPDTSDHCPTVATWTGYDGCPLRITNTDGDGDGVPNNIDKCPSIPARTNNGCPAVTPQTYVASDTDGDGVPDNVDACPMTPARTNNGCPAVIAPTPPASTCPGGYTTRCTDLRETTPSRTVVPARKAVDWDRINDACLARLRKAGWDVDSITTFQEEVGLPADGHCGPRTDAAIVDISVTNKAQSTGKRP